MKGAKESGGLDLPDYESIINSLRLLVSQTVKRMIDRSGEAWIAIPSYYLENIGGDFIFECNYVNNYNLNRLPEFYVHVHILKAWSEIKGECIPEKYLQNRDEILWNNKKI